MTWAALSAEIAVEMAGHYYAEVDEMERGAYERAMRDRARDAEQKRDADGFRYKVDPAFRATKVERSLAYQANRYATDDAFREAHRARVRERQQQMGRAVGTKTCGKCGQKGHNARTCRGVGA